MKNAKTNAMKTAQNRAKTQIRKLIARHDALAGRYASAEIAGQRGWAAARKRGLSDLARRIALVAKQHGLVTWTRNRVGR